MMISTHKTLVALTGASGFLGRHVHDALNTAGCEVRTLGRQALASSDRALRATLGALGRVDVIVHLAAAGVSPKCASQNVLRAVNVVLPERLVDAAASVGIGRLVMAGTAVEYGQSADEFDRLPPTAPLRPTSNYGRTKALGFAQAVGAAHKHSLSLDYLRVFNVYGEGQNLSALWPALREAARIGCDLKMSSGTSIRDFVNASKVADKFVEAVLQPEPGPVVTVRNVGTSHGTTVQDFATFWWSRWKAQGRLLFGSLPDRVGEPRRLVSDGGQPAFIKDSVDIL